MRIVTTKKFRATLQHYLELAREETIYITRPGDKLLVLHCVPDLEVEIIKRGYGMTPDKLISENNRDRSEVRQSDR